MEELKHETTTRPSARLKTSSMRRPYGTLRFGVAGAVGVGGIGEQQQHAAFAVIGEGVQVEELVIGGGGIDFEVAGVNDDAARRG